jgi:ATP-dependent 26S proteasome regulatory subunit
VINPYVPDRFVHRVLKHVIAASVIQSHPAILAIQGSPGTGKSFQVRECLASRGYAVVTESASALSGSWEGDSIAALREIWARCKEATTVRPGNHAVIVLEDFDLSPASKLDGTRYTVNSQLLNGFLMTLADEPPRLTLPSGHRVPIILTGNDFTTLHGPLMRPGRMDIFTWEPTKEELITTLVSAFAASNVDVDRRDVDRLVTRYPELTIAHYSAAVARAAADAAYSYASGQNATVLDDVAAFVHRSRSVRFAEVERAITELLASDAKPRPFRSK